MARRRKTPKPNAEYDLPSGLKPVPDKLMLAMDPGSRNFGISLIGLRAGAPVVYANSVLTNPISDLVAFGPMRDQFLKEIERWMDFCPNGVIAERFQTRGIGGPLIEQV